MDFKVIENESTSNEYLVKSLAIVLRKADSKIQELTLEGDTVIIHLSGGVKRTVDITGQNGLYVIKSVIEKLTV